jgi:hypothetical protein
MITKFIYLWMDVVSPFISMASLLVMVMGLVASNQKVTTFSLLVCTTNLGLSATLIFLLSLFDYILL